MGIESGVRKMADCGVTKGLGTFKPSAFNVFQRVHHVPESIDLLSKLLVELSETPDFLLEFFNVLSCSWCCLRFLELLVMLIDKLVEQLLMLNYKMLLQDLNLLLLRVRDIVPRSSDAELRGLQVSVFFVELAFERCASFLKRLDKAYLRFLFGLICNLNRDRRRHWKGM
jgi:hypothetical protein